MSEAIERLADEFANLSDEEWMHVPQDMATERHWDELSERVAFRDVTPACLTAPEKVGAGATATATGGEQSLVSPMKV